MAQCKLTAREFIVNCFSPQVAAICSPNAEATCQKNNLTFIEMLQPFCKLDSTGMFWFFAGFLLAETYLLHYVVL